MKTTPKILVVDDEQAICSGCSMILSDLGHKVDSCMTCGEGIEKIMKKKYGKDRSDQKYIYSLFPTGLIKCANKIAGLPRPKGCS